MKKHFTRGAPPLLIAMGLLLLVACKKDAPEPVVEGTVMEAGTGAPLVGAKVQLLQYTGEFLGSTSFDIIDETTSDLNGHYQVHYTDPDVVLSTIAYKDGYFTDDDNLTHVGGRPEYDANIALHPYAWLRTTLINQSGAEVVYIPNTNEPSGAFYLSQGELRSFTTLAYGNEDYIYILSPYPTIGGPIMDINLIQINKTDGTRIYPSYENSAAPKFEIYLTGHDTTDITIIY